MDNIYVRDHSEQVPKNNHRPNTSLFCLWYCSLYCVCFNLTVYYNYSSHGVLASFHGTESDVMYPEIQEYLNKFLSNFWNIYNIL